MNKPIRQLNRYRQIINVLLKHGFFEIVQRIDILSYIKFSGKIKKNKLNRISLAQRLRLVFEELGPAFIKLGQLLSSKTFLFPPDIIEELSKLQDNVPPIPFEEIKKIIFQELGQEKYNQITYIEPNPIGVASIGQVHKAKLQNDKNIVIKILKPDVEKILKTDLLILKDLASLLEKHMPEIKKFEPQQIVEQLEKLIEMELDLTNEMINLILFQKAIKHKEFVKIPEIYTEFCNKHIMVLEYIEGNKITNLSQAPKEFKNKILKNLMDFIYYQIFDLKFFHADPHPGNILITNEGAIAPVDFGQVGRISNDNMTYLSEIVIALVNQNINYLIQIFLEMNILDDNINLFEFKTDIDSLIFKYYGLELKYINMKKIINDITYLFNKYDIKMPYYLTTLIKAIITYEDLICIIDKNFNFIEQSKPYVKKLIRKNFNFKLFLPDILFMINNLKKFITNFPTDIKLVINKLTKNNIKINLEILHLQELIIQLDKISNRISISLIISALIIGSSLILRLNKPPFFMGYPIIGIIGYVFAVILGFFLVISFIRSGKW